MSGQEERNDTIPDSNKRKLEENILLAKQKAQEIAARLLTNADNKRPRFDESSGSPAAYNDYSSTPTYPVSYASQPAQYHGGQGASKKISIPNGKVGVIIGRGGETIKSIQLQSGAKIQITKDSEADPYSSTRDVELMGTSVQIDRAEQLITDLIAEADAGGSASSVAHGLNSTQPGAEQFVTKVPNNKVALLIGKGGETIKYMQSSSGARIQVIPLHLPPGDTSTERTVYINGSKDQIESAKELINEVISGKRIINTAGLNSSMQQPYYQPSSQWVPPGQPQMSQQPHYGYAQQGNYISPSPYYGNYAAQPGSWDQANPSLDMSQAPQQTTGYNYYGQQVQTAPGTENSSYNYEQTPTVTSNSYDQNSHQAYNYGHNISHQAPPYNQQEPYVSSGYGQATAYSQPDGTASSQLTQPPASYPHAYSQPIAAPQAGNWTSPSFAGQPPAQTGYSEIAYGEQQSASALPPSSQPAYGQSSYPLQPTTTSTHVHGTTYEHPEAQPQAPTNGTAQSVDCNAEKIDDKTAQQAHGSTPSVQETVPSQS